MQLMSSDKPNRTLKANNYQDVLGGLKIYNFVDQISALFVLINDLAVTGYCWFWAVWGYE